MFNQYIFLCVVGKDKEQVGEGEGERGGESREASRVKFWLAGRSRTFLCCRPGRKISRIDEC